MLDVTIAKLTFQECSYLHDDYHSCSKTIIVHYHGLNHVQHISINY